MLSHGEEKPPSRRMKRYWKVAVLANIKDESKPKPEGVPPDAFADFDHIETIDSIRAAIETDGHQTVFIQADEDLPFALQGGKTRYLLQHRRGIGRRRPRSPGSRPAGNDENSIYRLACARPTASRSIRP